MKLLALLLVLAGCETKTQLGERHHGLPDGAIPACSRDLVHPDRGVCIADGKRYRCVWATREDATSVWTDVSCSRSWLP